MFHKPRAGTHTTKQARTRHTGAEAFASTRIGRPSRLVSGESRAPRLPSNASLAGVSPEDLKKLRKELACTAKELALTLGIEPKEYAAWEAGELFPTKRYVAELEALRKKGPTSILRAPKGKGVAAKTGMARLAEPKLWELVRKLAEHPALFEQVSKLAEAFPDPAESRPKGETKQ